MGREEETGRKGKEPPARTKRELLEQARRLRIPGRHALTKEALRGAITRAYQTLASSPEGLRSLTKRDLLELARIEQIRGRGRMPKAELLEALTRAGEKWQQEAFPRGVQEAKYRIARAPHPVVPEGPEELPSAYGETRIVLMPVEPYWIHAYWEIAPLDLERAKTRLGKGFKEAKRIVRVYDITFIDFDGTNAWSFFDIEVGEARNWYINLWSAEKSLCADLGLLLPTGDFFALARSNVIQVPRPGPSDRDDEQWVQVGEQFELEERREEPLERFEGESPHGGAEEVIISGQSLSQGQPPIRSEPLRPDAFHERPQAFVPLQRSQRMWETEGLGGGLEKVEVFHSDATPSDRVGEGVQPLSILPTSPMGARPDQGQVGLHLTVETELILYGRVGGGGSLFLEGRPIPIRPDGTFSIRLVLPDGLRLIPVSVKSLERGEETTVFVAITKTSYRAPKS